MRTTCVFLTLKESGQSFRSHCLSALVSTSSIFLITPLFPRIKSFVRSRRCWSFSARYCASANHQTKESRDEGFRCSRYSHQRRRDLLRGHIFVSPLGHNYVFYDEGRILFTSVRVQRVLTNMSVLLASVTGRSISVSRPGDTDRTVELNRFSFVDHLPSLHHL